MQTQTTSVINRFTEYVMRTRRNAIMVVLITSFLPLFSLLANVIVALVTLRLGQREGFLVLLCASSALLVFFLWRAPNLLMMSTLVLGSVLIWCLANILRSSTSWAKTLEAAALITSVAVAAAYFYIEDMSAFSLAFWHAVTMGHGHDGVELEHAQQVFNKLSEIWAGIFAVAFMSQALLMLVIGRWLQSKLYNPNGLQVELHNIRLSIASVIALTLIAISAKLQMPVAIDLLIIMSFIFSVAGMSLLHYIASKVASPSVFLFGIYFMLIFFIQYAIMALSFLALADAIFDLRKRWFSDNIEQKNS